jgi:hypothetical protein
MVPYSVRQGDACPTVPVLRLNHPRGWLIVTGSTREDPLYSRARDRRPASRTRHALAIPALSAAGADRDRAVLSRTHTHKGIVDELS